jgi:hypothetical protein
MGGVLQVAVRRLRATRAVSSNGLELSDMSDAGLCDAIGGKTPSDG